MRDHFFDHLSALSRDRPSLIALQSEKRQVTYGELPRRIEAYAERLRRLGAGRVGLALDNGIDWALWDLAMMREEMVNVPLPGFFAPTQLAHVIDRTGIDTLIGPATTARAFGFEATHDPWIWRRPLQAAPSILPPGTRKITFTSGTSGTPKGVCLDSHAPLTVAASLAEVTRPCAIRHHLTVLPLATLLENIGGIYAPLWLGARVTLPSLATLGWSGASGFDSAKGWRVIASEAPDSLILVPHLLSALLVRQDQVPIGFGRFFAVGGATVSPDLLARAAGAGWPVYEGYGLSECASVVTLNRPGEACPGGVGSPLPHARVRLAADGEIHVEGSLMLGYLGDEAPAPASWPTGDLGEWQGDALRLKGRRRQIFVTAYGRNVDPAWVEAELTADPAISQAWVHGEAEPSNCALLVPRGERVNDLQLEAAVARANARLPDYARVTAWKRAEPFTPQNGLATANGRLRRDSLAAHYRTWLQNPMASPVP